MKILFLVNVDWFFVSHRLPIAEELLSKGVEVHLACAFTSKQALLEEIGIITHPLRVTRSGIGILSEGLLFRDIYKTVKTIEPDVIHTVSIKPVVYGSIASRIIGIKKVIASISGLGFVFIDSSCKAQFLRRFVTVLYRIGLDSSHVRVIFQNEFDKDLFCQNKIVKSVNTILIRGSGVNLELFKYSDEPSDKVVVMFMARFLKDKGICEFVDAANQLRAQATNCKFVLVGDIDTGNRNSIERSQLDDWVKSEVVEYWGHTSNPSEVIPKANIIVLPSYREGLPKSLIEASACGRAIITTDVPGCRDAIIPGETGLLVPPRNSELLAASIAALVDDVAMRRRFGVQARELAESLFDVRKVVADHMKIYGLDV